MAKHSDKQPAKAKQAPLPEMEVSEAPNSLTWIQRPDWELSFEDKAAVIKGVSDDDCTLLQQDDNEGFAKALTEWVAANAGKLKISRYQIQGKIWNIGTRGPSVESPKNPFKMRPPKASRGEAAPATAKAPREPAADASNNKAREISTLDVVQFILAGKLDAEVFKGAIDEVRETRKQQIAKLQAELDGFGNWEKLLAGKGKQAAE